MTTIEQFSSEELDPGIRPQDDLFGHVNGRWIRTAQIPDDRSSYGSFMILRDQAEIDVREIIEAAAASGAPVGSDERKIGDLYASFMDETAVEASGARPLQPILARIDSATDTDAFVSLLGAFAREGIGGFVGVRAAVDRGNPERYLLHLFQSGIVLPDESYYRADAHDEIRRLYVGHMARMLQLTGVAGGPEAADVAASVMDLEMRLASSHWDRVATRDAVKTYNLHTAEELLGRLPIARRWFEGMNADPAAWSEVVVSQPDFLEAATVAFDDVEVARWQQWLAWRTVTSYAPYLSREIVDENFAFFGTVLTGAPSLRARWKRGVSLVEGALGEAVGRIYVEHHYPPKAEAQMAALIDNLIEAYRVRIADLGWMAEPTRQRALAKLDAFTPKIGKPVRWRDYSALAIEPDDLIGNVQRARAFDTQYDLGRIGRPVDRDEWFMTPQTVNAYYQPTMNEIVFPAAVLQPPFFDPDTDPAYNYGAIGCVIGHEIGHGFDDQGSRYDGDGRLRDWWLPEDRERFDVKTTALIDQYSGLSPRELSDEHKVNGALTVGENIGDLGGLAVAHHAYRLSLGGAEAPVVDGLTGDQRFFVGWARCWRVIDREAEAVRRLTIDPHSPAEFRANAVRNIHAFHDAFGTSPADALWLEPDERVDIW